MAKSTVSDLISKCIESELIEEHGNKIVKYLASEEVKFLEFVECMKIPLTDPVNETRLKGTQLLSHVIKMLKKNYFNSDEIDVLVGFLVGKFLDHHLIAPKTLDGLYALVKCTNCSDETLIHIMKSIFRGLTVQTLLRQDRCTIYQLFQYILDQHLPLVQGMGEDFVAGFTQMVDSERDPRNLLIVFDMTSIVAASVPLGGMAEDLFEVVACYFPVDYHPPKELEEKVVTREEMQLGLQRCMVATPAFAPFCLPLIFDKLDSGWSEGRIDALECFAVGCDVFDVKLIHEYSSAVWSNVKRDMFSNKVEYDRVNSKVLRGMCRAFDENNKQEDHEDYLKFFVKLVFEECGLYLEQPSTPIFQHSIELFSLVASSSSSALKLILPTTISQLIKEFHIHKQVVGRLNLLKGILSLLVCRSATGGRSECKGILSVEVLKELKEIMLAAATTTNSDLMCFSLKTALALVVEGFYVDDDVECCSENKMYCNGDNSEKCCMENEDVRDNQCCNNNAQQCCKTTVRTFSGGEGCCREGAGEGCCGEGGGSGGCGKGSGGDVGMKEYKVNEDEAEILNHLLDLTFNTSNIQLRKVCAELLFMLSDKRRNLVVHFLFKLFTDKLHTELEKIIGNDVGGNDDDDDRIFYLLSVLACFSKVLLVDCCRFLFKWLAIFVQNKSIATSKLINCSVETLEKILELNNISNNNRKSDARREEEKRYLTGDFLTHSYFLVSHSTTASQHFNSQLTRQMSGLTSCITTIVKAFPSRDTRWFTDKCVQAFLQDPTHNLHLLQATACVCQEKVDKCEELIERCYEVVQSGEEEVDLACVCFCLLLDKCLSDEILGKYKDAMLRNNNILLWCHVTKVLLKHQHHMCEEFCRQLLVWLNTDETTSERTSDAVDDVIIEASNSGSEEEIGCCGGKKEEKKSGCCGGRKKEKSGCCKEEIKSEEFVNEEDDKEDGSATRFFHLMTTPLVSQYNTSKPECRKYHLQLFCHLSSKIPPSIIRTNITIMLPLVVQSLHYESNDQSKHSVWLSSLHSFRSFLSSCPDDVTSHLYDVTQRLLMFIVYPHDMAVRVESLKCLIQIGRLKQHPNLLTNRQAVLKVLDVSIGDKKRIVRKFASLAKYTWITLSEPCDDDD